MGDTRSWVLPHFLAFSLATLARGYFHTVEISHSLRSLVGTSTRSRFLTRYARSWVLPHGRAFSLATLARAYFRTLNFRKKNPLRKIKKKTKTIPWEYSFQKYSSQKISFCLPEGCQNDLKTFFKRFESHVKFSKKKNSTPKNQKKN